MCPSRSELKQQSYVVEETLVGTLANPRTLALPCMSTTACTWSLFRVHHPVDEIEYISTIRQYRQSSISRVVQKCPVHSRQFCTIIVRSSSYLPGKVQAVTLAAPYTNACMVVPQRAIDEETGFFLLRSVYLAHPEVHCHPL
eukprot:1196145-Prorocentrum_minimum.AAC.3